VEGALRWSPPSDPVRCGWADASVVEPTGRTSLGATSFTANELAFFMTLDHPSKVQDYLDTFPMNHEAEDDTCLSALEAVRQNHAHCIEAAMLAAHILSLHCHQQYLLDMRASSQDDDHIVVPFVKNGRWGCISKPNHAALRFRNGVQVLTVSCCAAVLMCSRHAAHRFIPYCCLSERPGILVHLRCPFSNSSACDRVPAIC
jgi:hypothetical protein